MTTILPIVEGHGEVSAVPLLIRRIAVEFRPEAPLAVARPIRSGRDSLVQPDGVERAVELAARQTRPGDGILVLLDADDDCPRDMAEQLIRRARQQRTDRNIRVVLANREFEAWFLAAASSLRGKRGLRADLESPADPEAIRDAKGWLTRNNPRRALVQTHNRPGGTRPAIRPETGSLRTVVPEARKGCHRTDRLTSPAANTTPVSTTGLDGDANRVAKMQDPSEELLCTLEAADLKTAADQPDAERV